MARGIRALAALGEPCQPAEQMLQRHGVVETINRTALHPRGIQNFQRLCAAGLRYLSAESIVLDRPHLFDPKAVEIARLRLGR